METIGWAFILREIYSIDNDKASALLHEYLFSHCSKRNCLFDTMFPVPPLPLSPPFPYINYSIRRFVYRNDTNMYILFIMNEWWCSTVGKEHNMSPNGEQHNANTHNKNILIMKKYEGMKNYLFTFHICCATRSANSIATLLGSAALSPMQSSRQQQWYILHIWN